MSSPFARSPKATSSIVRTDESYLIPKSHALIPADCHYAGLIGQTPLTEKILESVDFPEKLIFNRDADKVLEYVSKKHNIILKK